MPDSGLRTKPARPFLLPGVFAGLSLDCLIAAPVWLAVTGDWHGAAGLAVCAVVFAWLAHDMAESHRRGLRLARSLRRTEPVRNVRVLQTLAEPESNVPSRVGGTDETRLPVPSGSASVVHWPPVRDDWSRKV